MKNMRTKFETVGASYQTDSDSVKEAEIKFRQSCFICTKRGLHLDCDQCGIASTHALVIAAFDTNTKGV
jgi:hypothetical protein